VSHPPTSYGNTDAAKKYWHANLRLVTALLALWFAVSFGFGILLVEQLNKFSVFGFKLGFWWAQQGSIFAFVILIFVYAALMKRLDHRFRVGDREARQQQ
jgi:putative solute:sodium symporter small subunit